MSSRSASTPAEAFLLLQEGNARFVEDRRRKGRIDPERRTELTTVQEPFATVVGCSDSRVPFEHVFDVGIGDVFAIRNAGQTVDELTLGSIEFGTTVLGTPLLVVLRHTACGAVRAALDTELDATPALQRVVATIRPSIEKVQAERGGSVLSAEVKTDVELVGDAHRERTMRFISDNSPAIMELISAGKLAMIGAVYDLETGAVTFDTVVGNV